MFYKNIFEKKKWKRKREREFKLEVQLKLAPTLFLKHFSIRKKNCIAMATEREQISKNIS